MDTIFRLFPWFFGAVFVLIITWWIVLGYALVKGASTIEEKGLKGLTEQVWCGKNANCKLPEVAQ